MKALSLAEQHMHRKELYLDTFQDGDARVEEMRLELTSKSISQQDSTTRDSLLPLHGRGLVKYNIGNLKLEIVQSIIC